ncbi:MAG: DUF1552 domain-containing protein, partial [Acidobacteriota bacterium]
DGMVPAFAGPLDVTKTPALRLGYFYVPNGIIRDVWLPTKVGADFEMTPVLKQWAPFRDQLVVLSGLDGGPQFVGGHPRGSGMYLTGVDPKKSLNELLCGASVDQVAARAFGKQTQIESLELCIEDAAEIAGQAQGGYNAAYTNTISWRTPTQPLPMEHRPRAVFERLFGDGDNLDPAARLTRTKTDRSILDFVSEDTNRVLKELGASDRSKVSEFLDAVRNVESRIQKAEKNAAAVPPGIERPMGIPPTFEEHVKSMFDLQLLAYQTDLTRVSTFMLGREYSEIVYRNLGHTSPHHPLTHHRGVDWKIQQSGEVNVYHAKLFRDFLAKMQATKDGDGSLLDHSILLYGAGMGDGDIHNQWNLPVAMLGGGAGRIKRGGIHLQYTKGTPFANFHVALLNLMGIPTEKHGNSTGAADLSAIV